MAGSVEALAASLAGDSDTLVLPHGSAFPVDAWPAIASFLRRGGNLVVLGGAPFHQPVRFAGGSWIEGFRQPTYAHELLIGPAEAIDARGLKVVTPDESWITPISGAKTVWAMTVRLGTKADLPAEHGSEAHRDGVLRPLIHLVDAQGIPRAAPLVEIDRLRGDGAGGRWIFAPTDAPLDAKAIRAIVWRAREGASHLDARPMHASVEPGETPVIRIVLRRFVQDSRVVRATLVVRDDAGREVFRTQALPRQVRLTFEASVPIQPHVPLAPGLYHAEVAIDGIGISPHATTTGFWVRDDALLASAPPLSVSRDWIRRGGNVFPVNGTTYMASDVHRKFLFEPDPHVWDRDFAAMAKLGINFVRTGVWTGWSRAMLNSGAIDEGFLRALDAYVQSAAKHGIIVNYTFYAFQPLSFGGSNPYLDPRALEGQREFLATIAARYRGVNWIHWDLINEPSYSPADALWSNRPIRDAWEKKGWDAWVRRRHGDDLGAIRDRWRDRSGDPLALPRETDLWYVQIREDRVPRKTRDFVEFSQDAVAGWAADLRSALRAAGGDVLVTLGQDEGGTWLRPSQQLHAESIDYTAVHPWWQNDDLLATGVASKVPEKPMLFQETGLMRLEGVDGMPWRSPALAAQVLERKYAAAFAARGAGAVEWAWNINPYMPIDNESVIGFFRPDGTAKPELDVVRECAEFFRAAQPWLDDFEPDAVVAVIPHSRLFMGRPAATDGFRRMVRVMAERFGIVAAALSELRLTPERLRGAKLVIVPSPEVLSESAASALLAASRNGTKILVLGAVTGDPYGGLPPALRDLGIADRGRPVELKEAVGDSFATFDRNLRESLLRSEAAALGELTGNVWHEPVPLEHAREEEPLVALLARAFAKAGVEAHPSADGIAARLLYAPRAVFGVFMNETSRDGARTMTVGGRPVAIPVAAGQSRLVLFDRAS
ncbi:MAG TPA: hypothetical protein VFV54_12030, partial [Thermoanaerobaculia bacterium]|nr:hypothetical protein [Thermoanaerobaculia bacterium]